MAAARGPWEVGKAERQPEFGVFRETKALRHHSDDGVIAPAVTVERERSSQNIRIATEAALPQSLAQHHHAAPAVRFFFRGETPPQQWLHAERAENVCGYEC